MRRPRAGPRRPKPQLTPDDAERINSLYGLEPVFEPSLGDGDDVSDASAAARALLVQCPYCAESFETLLDLSAGSATYIEDCQVCCQPIEFALEVDAAGGLARFTAARGN